MVFCAVPFSVLLGGLCFVADGVGVEVGVELGETVEVGLGTIGGGFSFTEGGEELQLLSVLIKRLVKPTNNRAFEEFIA